MKISVIVPVYNAECFLSQCLDSILNQTFHDFEVICINDGSRDGSLSILQNYAKKDRRICVIDQENQGQGRSRNTGIEAASGEYIMFVDADDSISRSILENTYRKAKETQADIVLFDGVIYHEVTKKTNFVNYFLNTKLIVNHEVFSAEDFPNDIFQICGSAVWGKLYRRAFLNDNDIRFSPLNNSEDVAFIYYAMAMADRISYVPDRAYIYRTGLTTNVESNKEKTSTCVIESYMFLYHDLTVKGKLDLVLESWKKRFGSSLVHTLKTISSKEAVRAIWNRMQDPDVRETRIQEGSWFREVHDGKIVSLFLKGAYLEAVPCNVSVIIPIFNADKYLRECLNSLIRQTYHEFEIICVDDGSTDYSREIVNMYAAIDSRIKLIIQDNQGAAVARNNGIEHAKGEYIYFVDADDFIADTLIEKSYTLAKKHNADVVAFPAVLYDNTTKTGTTPKYMLNQDYLPKGLTVFSAEDCATHIFQFCMGATCTKFVKKVFIDEFNIRFQNLPNTNDVFFSQSILALAERITTISEPLYFYRVNLTNNTQSKRDDAPTSFVDAYLALRAFLISHGRFELVKKSWVQEFTYGINTGISKVTNPKSLKEIYARLTSPEVVSTGYFDDAEAYGSAIFDFNNVKTFLNGPEKYHDKDHRDVLFLSNDVLIPDPKVTVIIPVYNTAKYVAECLKSVLKQTLSNIEIICIDDGSTDESLQILLDFANKDKRVRIMSEKNSGQSTARNEAAKYARGEYLYFLDSDDLINETTLKSTTEIADLYQLDVLFFEGSAFSEENLNIQEEKYYTYSYEYPMDTGLNLFTAVQNHGEFKASVCTQLVRKSFFEESNLQFYEGIYHEDQLYTFKMMTLAKKACILKMPLFRRRVRKGSIMTQHVNFAHAYGYFICYTETLKYAGSLPLASYHLDAVKSYLEHHLQHLCRIYSQLSNTEKKWFEIHCTPEQRLTFDLLIKKLLITKEPQKAHLNEDYSPLCVRLDDHDTALYYAQEELEIDKKRLNDHDTALRYAQMEIAELRGIIENSLSRRISRIVLWLPRKMKRFLRRALFAKE